MRRSATGTASGAALLLLATLVLGACSAGGARNPFDGSLAQEREDRLSIQVQNLNFSDITVYAVSTGQRVRVGDITGKSDRSFRLTWNYANPIRFEISVVGGRDCATQPLPVEPGARVWVQVPNEIGPTPCASGRA